jgi:hypothetical protein
LTGSYCGAHTGLEFKSLLPQAHKGWDYRHVLPHPALKMFLFFFLLISCRSRVSWIFNLHLLFVVIIALLILAVVSSLLWSYMGKISGMGPLSKRKFLFIWPKYLKHPWCDNHWAQI